MGRPKCGTVVAHTSSECRAMAVHSSTSKATSVDTEPALATKWIWRQKWRAKGKRQRQSSAPVRSLCKRMDGATLEDWRGLADFAVGKGSQVRLYNPIWHTTSKCPPDIPWPVQWILTNYSSKHIFLGRGAPRLDALHAEIMDFSNRMKWRWVHRDEDRPSLPRYWKGPRYAPLAPRWWIQI